MSLRNAGGELGTYAESPAGRSCNAEDWFAVVTWNGGSWAPAWPENAAGSPRSPSYRLQLEATYGDISSGEPRVNPWREDDPGRRSGNWQGVPQEADGLAEFGPPLAWLTPSADVLVGELKGNPCRVDCPRRRSGGR
jgi:hypothetical protein